MCECGWECGCLLFLLSEACSFAAFCAGFNQLSMCCSSQDGVQHFWHLLHPGGLTAHHDSHGGPAQFMLLYFMLLSFFEQLLASLADRPSLDDVSAQHTSSAHQCWRAFCWGLQQDLESLPSFVHTLGHLILQHSAARVYKFGRFQSAKAR